MGPRVYRTALIADRARRETVRIGTAVASWLLALFLLPAALACADEPPPSETRVPLKVVQGPGGGTLVFVPVHIGSDGPYYFTLDTGASHSVIDKQLATQLGLPMSNTPLDFSGTISVSGAQPVKLQKWRVGELTLPSQMVVGLDLPDHRVGPPIQGLLGSDILSRFDRVIIDYSQGQLTLTPRSSAEKSDGSAD